MYRKKSVPCIYRIDRVRYNCNFQEKISSKKRGKIMIIYIPIYYHYRYDYNYYE